MVQLKEKTPELLTKITWAVQPKTEEWGPFGMALVWETKDGKCRAYRVAPSHGKAYFAGEILIGKDWRAESDPLGTTYCKRYSTLLGAMSACENLLKKEGRLMSVKSNREAVADQNETLSVVEESDVKMAEKPRKKKPTMVPLSEQVLEDGKPRRKKRVVAEEETPVKKKKVVVAEKEGKTPLDKFGNRVGSQAAAVNAAVSKKWQTAEEIAERAELPVARVKGHLQWLMKREHVVKENKNYRLA